MKEVFSAFGNEVFRPLMTLLAPGIVALAPWSIGLLQRNPDMCTLAAQNRTESALLFVLAALITGMLLEELGAGIEARRFDVALDKATGGRHSENWDAYLRTAFRVEPVGARYLRTVLLRMKFELGLGSAAIVVAFGLFATTLPVSLAALASLSACAFAALMFWEARTSHALLSHTRSLLLQGINVVGDVTASGGTAASHAHS